MNIQASTLLNAQLAESVQRIVCSTRGRSVDRTLLDVGVSEADRLGCPEELGVKMCTLLSCYCCIDLKIDRQALKSCSRMRIAGYENAHDLFAGRSVLSFYPILVTKALKSSSPTGG
jgi:hypothetical protein